MPADTGSGCILCAQRMPLYTSAGTHPARAGAAVAALRRSWEGFRLEFELLVAVLQQLIGASQDMGQSAAAELNLTSSRCRLQQTAHRFEQGNGSFNCVYAYAAPRVPAKMWRCRDGILDGILKTAYGPWR
jgi:hypothetical protein